MTMVPPGHAESDSEGTNGDLPGILEKSHESRILASIYHGRVEVEFKSSRREEESALSELERARYPGWFNRGLFPVVLGVGGLVLILKTIGGAFGPLRSLLVAAGVGIGLGLGSLLLDRRVGANRWARRIVVSPEGFREKPSFQPLVPWSRIKSVRETDGFFFFSLGFARGSRFLPKRVLSAGEIQTVRALILDNLWEPANATLLTEVSPREAARIDGTSGNSLGA